MVVGRSTAPAVARARRRARAPAVALDEPKYGRRWLHCDGAPELLFTENETNTSALFGDDSGAPYAKDAFHRFVVDGEADAVNPAGAAPRRAAHYALDDRRRQRRRRCGCG